MKSRALLPLIVTTAALLCGTTATAAVQPIAPDQFDRLHRMIRLQPGEQPFWRISWKLTVTEARTQAAREGKPIFVWAGAGGAPIGVC